MTPPFPILYEDNHLIAVDKPAGMLTQPNSTTRQDVETALREFIKIRDKKPGAAFVHAVHRLDLQVSGIVVCAKSQKALSRLSEALRNRSCQKEYTAIVTGSTPPPTGALLGYFRHCDHKAAPCSESDPGGRLCELHVLSCSELRPGFWKLAIELSTGRYHQIRAQLAASGFPIVGDTKYGSTIQFLEDAIALHHSHFSFPHPTKGQAISLGCPCNGLLAIFSQLSRHHSGFGLGPTKGRSS